MTINSSADFSVILDNFKTTYAKDLTDYRPNFTVLQELLPANKDGVEVGATLKIPVLLTHQGGESYDTSGGGSTLGSPVSLEIKDASTDQFEITERVLIPFSVLSKAAQSPKARFADGAKLRLLAGQAGAQRALELSLLHGSNSLGKVASVASVQGAGPYTLVVTFTAQSWSDGIWGASDNAPFDFYSALTAGTKRNTNDCSVISVDFVNKAVTFQAAASGDLSSIVAGDFIFSRGAYAKQMPGLMNVISTTTGSLFGISTGYSMWKAKQVTVSGPITFGKLVSGISPAVSHGADGTLTALVSPRNFADLSKDLASARRIDVSYKEDTLQNGAHKIAYKYNMGEIDVVVHPFMKDGDVAVIPSDSWLRVGSDPDPTMSVASQNLTLMAATNNAIETRFWCASALVPNILATSVYFSGITPNAS